MAERVEVLISEQEVEARVKELADQISKDYEGKELHIICILKGSVFFTCELAKRISIPVTLDFMSVSSYGSDTKSSGVIKIAKDLDESILDTFESYHPYMTKRHLTKDIIDKYKIRYDKDYKALVFPVWDINGNLKFLTRRSVENKQF